MGRVKLEIKKIENPTNRQVTYSKRRNGLMKKAYELSVLCDIDIAVIMFSPSGKLTVFSKDDRIEEVIGRYANTPQHERTKRKFENVEYLNKVLQKLSDERGSEPPRVGYAELQMENQELKTSYHKVVQEKNFYEQKARLFAGNEYINSFNSLEHLGSIKGELEQALEKVTERIGQLQEAKQMNAYRQSALHQTSAYEMLPLSGREAPSSLNDGSNVGSSSDVVQGVQMHGAWGGIQLENGASMLSSSQMRESAGADFEASSSSFYQRRASLQPVYNELEVRPNYATKIEDTSQFAYGGGGQGQIPALPNQVKQDNTEYPFYGSLHQPQQPSGSWGQYNQL